MKQIADASAAVSESMVLPNREAARRIPQKLDRKQSNNQA